MAVAQIRIANFLRQANSDDMAGKITYLAPVDNASGKIFGKKERFVAVRRLTGKRQRGCAVTGVRTSAVTEKESAWRAKFAEICNATHERMADPAYMASDQAAFNKQSKYDSLYQFVWNACKEELGNGK